VKCPNLCRYFLLQYRDLEIVIAWNKATFKFCESFFIYCRNEGREMVLFKDSVKEIKGRLVDLLKAHVKAEHDREFE
jgi:hypothetical protein